VRIVRGLLFGQGFDFGHFSGLVHSSFFVGG
jgi:hypothetical protein